MIATSLAQRTPAAMAGRRRLARGIAYGPVALLGLVGAVVGARLEHLAADERALELDEHLAARAIERAARANDWARVAAALGAVLLAALRSHSRHA